MVVTERGEGITSTHTQQRMMMTRTTNLRCGNPRRQQAKYHLLSGQILRPLERAGTQNTLPARARGGGRGGNSKKLCMYFLVDLYERREASTHGNNTSSINTR